MTLRLPGLFLFAALAGCTASEPTTGPGSTEFVTEEPEYDYNSSGPTGGASDMGLAASADGGGALPGAPMGRTGTIEEGDIYRIDHNRLFYFNTYRGLMIYDLGDAQHPMKISRVPVYGYPVEMYVDGDRVYALIRDALYLTQDGNGQKFEEHRTSQLVTIDVSDLANPVVLKTIDIVGQLREGLSRKIDDTIYVVSYIPQGYYDWWWNDWGWYGTIDTDKEQAWTYSFNVADPQNPQLVDKLQIFEGGGASASGGGGSVSRWFEGVAISATANTLEVVENWETYGYVPYGPDHCGSSFNSQQAVVSLVDISDPSGHIRLYTKFDTYGALGDQFKQTYVYDDVSKKAYYYGIFARREWEYDGCSGGSFIQNSFQTWDVTDGANPTRVGFLPFGDKNETVSATLFDTSRHVAYAITSHAIDPMFAIGYADPAAPSILSQIDGLNGNINVFSFIGSTRYLLGIGTDSSSACTGFDTGSNTWWHTGVSVSILDVQDLAATRLVQRRCIDVKDAEWVSSSANWNLDQGHKMIGMGSTGAGTVVTVPVDYYKRTDEDHWYWWEGGSSVGMMSFDLSADDPSKPPAQQNVLVNHGSFEHTHGSVRRTIVFQHEEATGSRPMVLNLSDSHLSLFDISDLDAPVKQSDLEIAPDVQELYKFGDYMVEHVRDEAGFYSSWDLRSEFRVKPMGGRLDDTAPVATFSVGQVERVERWKDSLVIFRRPGNTWGNYDTPTSQIVVFDLSNPTAPVLRSVTDLGFLAGFGYYGWWCGWRGYFGGWWWSSPSSWMSIDSGVVFRVDDYGSYPDWHTSSRLVYVDLSDLTSPQVRSHSLDEDGSKVAGLTPDEGDPRGFFVTRKEKVGERAGEDHYKLVAYKYYAQRWSVHDDDIAAGDSTNLPGQLVRSWRSGERTMLLSQDRVYHYDKTDGYDWGYYDSDERIHLLERTGDSQGTLRDSTTVAGRYLEGLTADGDRLYLTTGYSYVWSTAPPSTQPDTSDHLAIFDLSQQKLDRAFDDGIGLRSFSVMGSDGPRLFLNLYGDGVLVLDATDPAHPVGRSFLRTLGWGSHLELGGNTLFVAAGQFGVFQRDLGGVLTHP